MRQHAELVENLLRGILTRGISSGAFADQNADVALVNACMAGRPGAGGEPHRRSTETDTEAVVAFVLRAVGARR